MGVLLPNVCGKGMLARTAVPFAQLRPGATRKLPDVAPALSSRIDRNAGQSLRDVRHVGARRQVKNAIAAANDSESHAKLIHGLCDCIGQLQLAAWRERRPAASFENRGGKTPAIYADESIRRRCTLARRRGFLDDSHQV